MKAKIIYSISNRILPLTFVTLIALAAIFLASVSYNGAIACCPDGRVEGPDGGHTNGACDPAFAYADDSSLKNLADRSAEFWSILHVSSEKKAFTQREKSEWKDISQRIISDPYVVALDVWSKNYSKNFKRMVLTKANALVHETEQMENLKFMLACLDSIKTEKQNCLELAKGNRLERKLASSRLALIGSNPQFRSN